MRLLMTAHPCDDDGSQADELPVRQREDNFTINVDPIEVCTVLPHQEPDWMGFGDNIDKNLR